MLEFNGTAIIIAISFVIFVILENYIFYAPMKKTLDERNNYILENEQEADKNISAAQTLVQEKDEKIAKAKVQSASLLNETSLKTQEKFDSSVREAKIASNKNIENIKKNLEEEKLQAQNVLKKEIGVYASAIISKILKKDVIVVNVNDEIVEKAMRGEL